MEHSSFLKSHLRGDNGSGYLKYFRNKKNDLADLDSIRQGVREPRLWRVCIFYELEAFVPEFIDLYLNDLRNMRRWANTDGIDTLLIGTSGPDPTCMLAIEWLVKLVQYGERPIPPAPSSPEAEGWKAIFAAAYAWSVKLLTFALQGVDLDAKLASLIYHIAIERAIIIDAIPETVLPKRMRETDKGMLMDVMRFAHKNGADTTDGCDIAAEDGNVECLRLAHELGGSMADVCNIAARSGNVECLRVAHELGSPIQRACSHAAAYGHVECLRLACRLGSPIRRACSHAAAHGHVECLRLAYQLGGEIRGTCMHAAGNGHVECLRVAHELGDKLDGVCEEAVTHGKFACFKAALDMGARIGKSCEIAAKHGHVKCLKLACMVGGDIGRSCEIAVENDHFRCFLIAKDHGGNIAKAHEAAVKYRNVKVLYWFASIFNTSNRHVDAAS